MPLTTDIITGMKTRKSHQITNMTRDRFSSTAKLKLDYVDSPVRDPRPFPQDSVE